MEETFSFGTHAAGIVIAAIAIMALLGITFGAILAIASKKFHVDVDPRVEKILEALPGANCGGCGLPGCSPYAEAVATGEIAPDKCAPGGAECAAAIAKIMGMDHSASDRKVAVLGCRGGGKLAGRFDYAGVRDCRAADLLLKGEKVCDYGCLGLGTCADVCPFDAIIMRDGLPFIIEEKCTACGNCVEVCPLDLLHLESEKKFIHVGCTSRDKGGVVNRICEVGCIGCKKCEKACPLDAIHVIDNIAVIDYDKCKNCGKCLKVCPKGVIYSLMPARRAGKAPLPSGK